MAAEDNRLFIGLFESVDTNDGSLTQRQITCDGHGNCTVLGSGSFFALCRDVDRRGILEGKGTVSTTCSSCRTSP